MPTWLTNHLLNTTIVIIGLLVMLIIYAVNRNRRLSVHRNETVISALICSGCVLVLMAVLYTCVSQNSTGRFGSYQVKTTRLNVQINELQKINAKETICLAQPTDAKKPAIYLRLNQPKLKANQPVMLHVSYWKIKPGIIKKRWFKHLPTYRHVKIFKISAGRVTEQANPLNRKIVSLKTYLTKY